MRKKKLKVLLIAVGIVLAGWGSLHARKQAADNSGNSMLVLYYSQTGATRQVAEEIARQTGAAIDSIVAADSYGTDYDETIKRWRQEREEGKKVEILPLTADIDKYDTIFLGFPIWGGTYASPIATYLSDNSLKGKRVVTFATFGSGGIESATADVVRVQPEAEVVEGYGVRNARLDKASVEIDRFLIENGYKEGTIRPLPDYGTPYLVNNKDKEVFDAACSGYRFPLGTPVTVARRLYEGGEDYRFSVISQGPDGKEVPATVYVTVSPGQPPEFTRVVR